MKLNKNNHSFQKETEETEKEPHQPCKPRDKRGPDAAHPGTAAQIWMPGVPSRPFSSHPKGWGVVQEGTAWLESPQHTHTSKDTVIRRPVSTAGHGLTLEKKFCPQVNDW